ncbi:MAG: hypothetical protein M3253_03510 [Chloroflexota bacterium]|nr:hypothetical protein [Chloroflexota bacterium]
MSHQNHQLGALIAHARSVPADERARLATQLRAAPPPGSVLLETCHRVELYSSSDALAGLSAPARPDGAEMVVGTHAVRHLIRLAVGRDSAIVAEDQLLHQLRAAVQHARASGPLAPGLDTLLDLCLSAGRRARSWLPASRPSLVDVALERVIGRRAAPPAAVLVVGAGEMGRRAASALRARGGSVMVASRTPERSMALAAEVGGESVPFDPGDELIADLAGVVIALAGRWQIDDRTALALRRSGCWLVDLSAPPAITAELAVPLGRRLTSIDELAGVGGPPPSRRLIDRLDTLVEDTVWRYEAWVGREAQRSAARALAEKAAAARSVELNELWQRIPGLDARQRQEVELMADHLTRRLLREPLEQLHADADGRHAAAARELFRL